MLTAIPNPDRLQVVVPVVGGDRTGRAPPADSLAASDDDHASQRE
jgi:hypothetical protein